MSIPKQLINLLGLVVVIGVLVAGVALAALPLFGASQATDSQTRTVAQTNDVYEIQVQQLSAAEERMSEITASLVQLRREISATPQLDDAHEIIIDAAAETGVTITTVVVDDPEAWTPRVSTTEDDPSSGPVTEDAATPEAGAGDAATGDAATPAAPGSGSAEMTDGGFETAPSADASADAEAETSPQRQIPLTITVEVADAAQAAAFMDALGRGPRLIAPIDGTLADGTLIVSALLFTRTEE